MSPDDLAAVLKEKRGVPILKPDGTPYKHAASEWPNARNSVQKGIRTIRRRLDDLATAGQGGTAEAASLRAKLGDLSRVLDQYKQSVGR